MSRRPRRNRPPRLDVDPVAAFADDVASVVPGESPKPRRSRPCAAACSRPASPGPHARLRARRGAGVDPGARERRPPGPARVRRARRVHARRGARRARGRPTAGTPTQPRAAIDPDCTVAAIEAGRRAHRRGGPSRRPHRRRHGPAGVAARARPVRGRRGGRRSAARVLVSDRATVDGATGRELWWIGGVAVLTDGAVAARRPTARATTGSLPSAAPTSWSPTGRTPGCALRAGCEVVAWADLDAPALALAAARGRRILVVPARRAPPGRGLRSGRGRPRPRLRPGFGPAGS